MRKTWRKWWLQCHLVLGLSVGLLFSLLGLTGSLLVFYLDIEAALEPQTRVYLTHQVAVDPDRVLQVLRQQYPQREGPWRIEMPLHDTDPVRVRYMKPVERLGAGFAPLLLTLDSSTLTVSSEKYWGDGGMTWVYDLHYRLLAGEAGRQIVGFAGLALSLSLLSGLCLWWPRWRHAAKTLKLQWRHTPAKRVYDLHVLSGAYGALVLLVLSLSGAALVWPQEARSLLFGPAEMHKVPGSVPVNDRVSRISLRQAMQVSQSKFTNAQVRWLHTSGVQGEPIGIRMRQPSEPGRRFPKTWVWVHPENGDILHWDDPLHDPWQEQFMNWMHPLHNGEALGRTGRWLVFLAGLLLPTLFVTGVVRWRQKRRAQMKTTGFA